MPSTGIEASDFAAIQAILGFCAQAFASVKKKQLHPKNQINRVKHALFEKLIASGSV